MSYEIETKAIAEYVNAQNYFGFKKFALDGAPADLTEPDTGFLTVVHGAGGIKSLGAPGANLHLWAGVAFFTFVTDIRQGKGAFYGFADVIVDAFLNTKIDETGAIVGVGSTVVINFAPGGLSPYISQVVSEAPFHRVVVNAPFSRTERT